MAMALHERVDLEPNNGGPAVSVLRVPTGWIYEYWKIDPTVTGNIRTLMQAVFVPQPGNEPTC